MANAASRLVRTSLVALTAASLFAAPAHAQPRGLGVIDSPLSGPRFVATAISVKALDETGWDWPGSDEVWLELWDFERRERNPAYFSDFDTNEVKNLPANKRCVAPQPGCDRGVSSLNVGIGLWEVDDWDVVEILGAAFCPGSFPNPNHEEEFDAASEPITYPECETSGEDLIGKAKVKYSQAQLLAMLPTVGQSVDQVIRPEGGSGKYQVTIRITRLANAEPVISDGGGGGQPTVIALSATVQSSPFGSAVNLTWSGATGSSVDIQRNNALLVTTANDGQHSDTVAAGSYTYRVCNAGSSVCSATVPVTVP